MSAMRRNCSNLNLTGQFTEKNSERKALQAEPAQRWQPSDREAMRRFTNVFKGGCDFGKIPCAESGLLCFVVGDLLQMLGFDLRKERNPHLSSACALR